MARYNVKNLNLQFHIGIAVKPKPEAFLFVQRVASLVVAAAATYQKICYFLSGGERCVVAWTTSIPWGADPVHIGRQCLDVGVCVAPVRSGRQTDRAGMHRAEAQAEMRGIKCFNFTEEDDG
ncbi:hypothetical protein CBL_05380 [Carabus blaptoides fortunei]